VYVRLKGERRDNGPVGRQESSSRYGGKEENVPGMDGEEIGLLCGGDKKANPKVGQEKGACPPGN